MPLNGDRLFSKECDYICIHDMKAISNAKGDNKYAHIIFLVLNLFIRISKCGMGLGHNGLAFKLSHQSSINL